MPFVEDCLNIALRVLTFYLHLSKRAPGKEELLVLKQCAGPTEEGQTPADLALGIIKKSIDTERL